MSILQNPPDEHEKDELRFLCTRNIDDVYCDIAFENFEKDKSAPDFDVCVHACIIIISDIAL